MYQTLSCKSVQMVQHAGCADLATLAGVLLMPRACDSALLRRLSGDLWAVEGRGLLSWAELGRGRFLLGPCPLSRLERICCKLSAFSCCLLKDAPLAILHATLCQPMCRWQSCMQLCVSPCAVSNPCMQLHISTHAASHPACISGSVYMPLAILHPSL